MIISHKYNFIFIKTNKTAGTSMEIGLSRFCGPKDIITPITAPDEKLRRDFSGISAQNYKIPVTRYNPRDYLALIRGRPIGYYNHMSSSEIRRLIGSEVWSSYYKFCFERNPWDRLVSYYYWRFRAEPRPSMSEFLESKMPTLLKKRGIDLYTIDGVLAVDKIYKYEFLQESLEDIGEILKFPAALDLPMAKASFRSDKRSYREILKPVHRDKISELFKDEIRNLGYVF